VHGGWEDVLIVSVRRHSWGRFVASVGSLVGLRQTPAVR